MGAIEHRRRAFRRWRCACGSRFPCGAYLNRGDLVPWRTGSVGAADTEMVGWNVRLGAR